MKKALLIITGSILLFVAPIIVLVGTTYTLLLPNMYSSSAKIAVSEATVKTDPTSPSKLTNDPSFLRSQLEEITSRRILWEVSNNLNLQDIWSNTGDRLPQDIAYKILRNSITVFQLRDTSLIVISVMRDDPMEAADIANEIVEVYQDARSSQAKSEAQTSINQLASQIEEQRKRVEFTDQALKQLSTSTDQNALYEAETDLKAAKAVHLQLKTKHQAELINFEIPRNLVELIDVAVPNMQPVSPNLFVNVIISIVMTIIVGTVGIVLLVIGIKLKKTPPANRT